MAANNSTTAHVNDDDIWSELTAKLYSAISVFLLFIIASVLYLLKQYIQRAVVHCRNQRFVKKWTTNSLPMSSATTH